MLYPDTVILVYAKAPVKGRVNTRLAPDIGVERATELHKHLLAKRLQQLADAALCDVVLMCAPDCEHAFFQYCQLQYKPLLSPQKGKDLGERMLNGAQAALEKYRRCMIVGADAPALDANAIEQAINALGQADTSLTEVVFVPAEDGGYVLLGMTRLYRELFENISWGSGKVMQQSREKLESRRVAFTEMPVCWDIDRKEDYERYLQMFAGDLLKTV